MVADLSSVPVFHGVPFSELGVIARAGEHRTFAPGEALVRQGDPCDSLYVIVSGQVRVERSHPVLRQPVHLANLGVGATVGEASGVPSGAPSGAPRAAAVTATALEPTEALRLPAAALARLLEQHPAAVEALLRRACHLIFFHLKENAGAAAPAALLLKQVWGYEASRAMLRGASPSARAPRLRLGEAAPQPRPERSPARGRPDLELAVLPPVGTPIAPAPPVTTAP